MYKMKSMLSAVGLVLTLTFSGCSSPVPIIHLSHSAPEVSDDAPNESNIEKTDSLGRRFIENKQGLRLNLIRVISDPPGARIEVDGDYVGDAPCDAQVDYRLNTVKIRAIPNGVGNEQIKEVSDKVQKVFFNMNLSSPPDVKVNIKNE